MQFLRERPWYAEANRTRFLVLAAVWIVLIAVVDWSTAPHLGLDLLYFFALILASPFLSHWQIAVLAYICAVLGDAFAYFPPEPERLPRAILAFLAYAAAGLVVRQLAVYGRAAASRVRRLQRELDLRHETQEQLLFFINSCPAAFVMVGADGKIGTCNTTAHEMFGVPPGALTGQLITSWIPHFGRVLETQTGSEPGLAMECRCRRSNGDEFPAHLWLSSVASAGQTMTALMIVHASNGVPDRGLSLEA